MFWAKQALVVLKLKQNFCLIIGIQDNYNLFQLSRETFSVLIRKKLYFILV